MLLRATLDGGKWSAWQQIPHTLLRNLKVHYQIHNSQAVVTAISQLNPFQTYFFKRHFIKQTKL
jgi:hypothetical protein